VWAGRWLSSRRRLDREQQTLLRLIRYELDGNRHRLAEIKQLCESPHPRTYRFDFRWKLRTDHWEQARVRLTELLEPVDRWQELFMYYAAAQALNDFIVPYRSVYGRDKRKEIVDMVGHLQKVDDMVLRWLDPYLYTAEHRPLWREYFPSRKSFLPLPPTLRLRACRRGYRKYRPSPKRRACTAAAELVYCVHAHR
jgi:hypothetical protein